MKFDACAFVGDSLYCNSVTAEQLNASMHKFGIEKAIIRPFKPCDYNYDKANRYIAEIQEKYDNIIGFGRVNPLEKTAPEQVAAIVSYGLRGIHLHPWEDNFIISGSKVDSTIKVCEENNLIVYVSTGYPNVSEPLQLWELAMRFPKVTFAATHGAQLDISGLSFDDALYMADHAKNVYFDLSGVYRRDFIEKLIRVAGESRVIFGSCSPYMDPGLEIARIESAQIPEEQKSKIFYDNINALL